MVWPENSTSIDPTQYPPIYQEIASAASAIGRPILVGAVLQDPLRNAGVLWLPGKGPTTVYLKRQLVPFGEFLPFRGLISKITSLTSLLPQDFTPGTRPWSSTSARSSSATSSAMRSPSTTSCAPRSPPARTC